MSDERREAGAFAATRGSWNEYCEPYNTTAICECVSLFSFRQMFPAIIVALDGLKLDAMYNMVLEIPCIDGCRYKYTNSRWVKASASDVNFAGTITDTSSLIHPDGPNTGRYWMEVPVSFKKAKITNDPKTTKGHVKSLGLDSVCSCNHGCLRHFVDRFAVYAQVRAPSEHHERNACWLWHFQVRLYTEATHVRIRECHCLS